MPKKLKQSNTKRIHTLFYFLCTLFFMWRFSYMTTCFFSTALPAAKFQFVNYVALFFCFRSHCEYIYIYVFGIDETVFDKSYLDTFGKYFWPCFLSFVTAEIRLKFATETNIGEFYCKIFINMSIIFYFLNQMTPPGICLS